MPGARKKKIRWGLGLSVLAILTAAAALLFFRKRTPCEYSQRPEFDFTKQVAKEFWCVQECLQAYTYERLYVNKGLGGRWGKLTVTRTASPPVSEPHRSLALSAHSSE